MDQGTASDYFSGVIQDGNSPVALVVGLKHARPCGANTYSAGTFVDGGTLEVRTTSSLPGYDNNSFDAVAVARGATLAVGVGGTSDWQATDIANLLANWQFDSGSALGIDTSDGAFSCPSIITDTVGGPLGLAKFGENSLTISGENTDSAGDGGRRWNPDGPEL